MSIFLQNMMRMAQGSRDIAMPTLISGAGPSAARMASRPASPYMQLIIFVVTFITMLALTQFIGRSRMGRACRACSEDIKMANLLGIDTHVVISITFVLGPPWPPSRGAARHVLRCHQPYLGFMAGLKAFTAAVLGGIGSIPGAVLGGLLLGVVEALSPRAISAPSTRM